MSRSKKPERWRIKLVANMIRQVRGKPVLEALYNLQGGLCAYDRQPCLLLLQPTEEMMSLGLVLTKELRGRCATIDHVIPRSQGGANNLHNYAMASQIRNCEKGSLGPQDGWAPAARRWPVKVIEDEIIRVERRRWEEAASMARHVSSKFEARKVVVATEIEKLYGRSGLNEIYTRRPRLKIKDQQKREEHGEKTQEVRKPRKRRRYRPKPVRPRRTIKD